MKNHSSKDAYFERLRNLADVNKVSIRESKTRNLGTLIDYKRATDGVAYGIIKENHQYYIKKAGLKQDPNVSDFAYIGGQANITEFQYKSLAEADKNRNMLFATINESLNVKFNKSGKKIVNEDKAAEEINASSEMADDLDAVTADAAAAEDTMAAADAAGDAEMAAGLESEPGIGDAAPADEVPTGDEEVPAGDGEVPAGDGEAPTGDEEVPADDEDGEIEKGTKDEIKSDIGKIGNKIQEKTLTDSKVEEYVNMFLGYFKDSFVEMPIEQRKDIANKILEVVPDEEIEDLGANVEDTEAKAEVGLEEEQCAECGGFGSYAESRGYTKESIRECGEEEMGSLVSGYANAYNDGQNDGDFKMVALLINPEMIEKLKGDYGHDEYAEKLTPYVNQLGESDEASKAAQIDELWGGIKNLGKAAGAGIKAGAQAVGQAAQAVGQKVGQAATAVKQTYHAGEVPGEIKKLETIAADLGKQIASLNTRLQKAGKQPVNMSSILQSITNQLGSKGSAALGKYGIAAEGIDPANVETQPNMLKEDDEVEEPETEAGEETGEDTKDSMGFAPDADVLGGGVVKPDGAEIEFEEPEVENGGNGKEIEIKDSTVNITVNENLGLAMKGTGSPKGKGKPFVKEEKPSAGLSKEKKSDVVKAAKAGKDIGKKGKGFEKVEKAAEKSGAKDPKAVAAAAMWKNIKREGVEEKDVISEAEARLRKYIRARLEEKAGIRKAVIAEGVKTEKVQNLDKLIDAQFALYESKFKKNIKESYPDFPEPGSNDGVKPSQLKVGEKYTWFMGAEPLEATYLGFNGAHIFKLGNSTHRLNSVDVMSYIYPIDVYNDRMNGVDEGIGANVGHFLGVKSATKAKINNDLKSIDPNDMNAVNKLFFEIFGKNRIKKALIPQIKATSAPERYQILVKAGQDPDGIGTLAIGSNGKLAYKSYKSVNWGDPGVHIFGGGQ